MNIQSYVEAVETEQDYEQALAEIDTLFGAELNTPQGDRLDALATMIEAYEQKHYPIDLPDPVSALEYHIESRGMTPDDLEPYIGSRADVFAVLIRTKALTLDMIRKLHRGLGISADILIQDYPLLNKRRVSVSKSSVVISKDTKPTDNILASDSPAGVFSPAE